ncbi:CopD family protein [Sphingomonas donggukensis]|uniref:Protoporphyrinogen IX oxidase n=1 Tax=Sphingomonas donggukensis TaxID=2949093 RepID=A0ABY4TVS9_9SPHN|nr:CopD family protein [Sphingomonas donggukensis]URW75274.1 CopD family protein [Sphingomonas donggukensis]
MTGLLGAAYPWVKAAHVVFVIFWMAGLFMLPRYLVYHQEGLGDAAEEARWIKREGVLRRMILTPSLVAVWLLGLLLAANLGLFDGGAGLGWLHAKLLIVVLLSGYHGWAVSYAKRLATGEGRLSGRTLRMVNEVPALAAFAIVVLVIVRPF